MGELLINTLVDKSNKALKKKNKNSSDYDSSYQFRRRLAIICLKKVI